MAEMMGLHLGSQSARQWDYRTVSLKVPHSVAEKVQQMVALKEGHWALHWAYQMGLRVLPRALRWVHGRV